MNETITILLATYNGAKYIDQQLNSILSQTYTDWQLLIRDDGSKDDTLFIISKYIQAHPGKIWLIANEEKNGGSSHNFSVLLQHAGNAGYIMFCDQDDEWKPNKIELTLQTMKEQEALHDAECPVLIFTNFQYVDENMQVIPGKKDFEINRLGDLTFAQSLAHNPVYGCTTIMNHALADKVGTIPPQADFHDHWIALVAAAFGEVCYMKEKTVLYRQHGRNLSGSFDNDSVRKRFQRIVMQQKNMKEAKAKFIMLSAFKERYYSSLKPEKKAMMDRFLALYTHKNPFLFLKSFFAGIRCQTLAQTALLYASIFFSKPLHNPSNQ